MVVKDNKLTSIKDVIWGSIVGDVLALPHYNKPQGTFECVDIEGDGKWSYNIDFLLATEQSCIVDGICNPTNIKHNLTYAYHSLSDRQIDIMDDITMEALSKNAAPNKPVGYTDAPLLRIAPLAQFSSIRASLIRDTCGITHTHEICKYVCVEYVRLLSDIMTNKKFDKIIILDIFPELDVLAGDIDTSNRIRSTIFAALWAFVFSDSFAECVRKAVNLGGNTIGIGSVAGGLAGAFYGYSDIPQEWIDRISNVDVAKDIVGSF